MKNSKPHVITICTVMTFQEQLKSCSQVAASNPDHLYCLIINGSPEHQQLAFDESGLPANLTVLPYPSNRPIETQLLLLQFITRYPCHSVFFSKSPGRMPRVSWFQALKKWQLVVSDTQPQVIHINASKLRQAWQKDTTVVNDLRNLVNQVQRPTK
jgi:hypothetical protein